MSHWVWSERPPLLEGGVLRRCEECALWMKDGLWLSIISEKQGDYMLWGNTNVPQQGQKQVNSHSNSPPGQKWSSHQHKVVFSVRSANHFITEHPIESSLIGDETPTIQHKLSRHWSSIYRELDKETKLCHTVIHATVKGLLYVF